jgi:hypothetical protein
VRRPHRRLHRWTKTKDRPVASRQRCFPSDLHNLVSAEPKLPLKSGEGQAAPHHVRCSLRINQRGQRAVKRTGVGF